ncbi:hypothetical protein ACFVUN_35580 [Kitasatospora griseola]|uniref:hypothetical protein n=1 Tax=Kitasatospora griseola TaxID=2064 RepID=UPI0036D90496
MSRDWEAELSSQLEELVMSEERSAPVSAVDSVSALRRGRKVRRRRAAATAGAAAVLLGSLTVGLLQGGGRPAPVQPAVPTGGPARTDPSPLAGHVRFGWLPDDVATVDTSWRHDSSDQQLATAASDRQWMLGSSDEDPRTDPPRPPGWQPEPGEGEITRTPAPAVNGREAFWVSVKGVTLMELRFRDQEGRWLSVSGMGSRALDKDVLSRIAAGVQVGRYVLPVPVSLDASTPLSSVIAADFRRTVRGAVGWQLSVQVSVRDNATVVISAESGSLPADPSPARQCASGEGMWWCAAPFWPDGPSPKVSENDVKAWFDRLNPHGPDESTWRPVLIP